MTSDNPSCSKSVIWSLLTPGNCPEDTMYFSLPLCSPPPKPPPPEKNMVIFLEESLGLRKMERPMGKGSRGKLIPLASHVSPSLPQGSGLPCPICSMASGPCCAHFPYWLHKFCQRSRWLLSISSFISVCLFHFILSQSLPLFSLHLFPVLWVYLTPPFSHLVLLVFVPFLCKEWGGASVCLCLPPTPFLSPTPLLPNSLWLWFLFPSPCLSLSGSSFTCDLSLSDTSVLPVKWDRPT